MKFTHFKSAALAVAIAATASFTAVAAAEDNSYEKRAEVSLLGGVQVLNSNDTALPDQVLNVPIAIAYSYHLSPIWALEGELTWLIPVEQELELGAGSTLDARTPDILAYQANVRANWPGLAAPWAPYAAAGVGVMTFLSNTDSDRVPALDETQTVFAINFGAGVNYRLSSSWGIRADFREFVAFPGEDTEGLSSDGEADPIWMERGTVGLSYRF